MKLKRVEATHAIQCARVSQWQQCNAF